MNSKKIIVALDGMNARQVLSIARTLENKVWGFKVNDLIFDDPNIIKKLKVFGNVFADVKLYDIPNTVANSVKKLVSQGSDIITVHSSGGIEMMKSAKLNSGKTKIIAVTVLTSKILKNKQEVSSLVKDAIKAKVDGVVCSGHELRQIKGLQGSKKMIKVVPGIRPTWYKQKDDQKRKMTPETAIELGADFLVIGRPITQYKNKKDILKAVDRIVRE